MINAINYIAAKLFIEIANFRLKKNKLFKLNFDLINSKINSISEYNSLLPKQIIKSVVSIEDRRYFNHFGVDLYSICRAIFKYFISNRIEGASTIEQQLVRSITNERQISINRKFNEICLAVLISKKYDKIRILSYYLITYQFYNIIGIERLCLEEKLNLQHISNYEAASVAARLKYPKIHENNYIKYLKRVGTIEIKNYA